MVEEGGLVVVVMIVCEITVYHPHNAAVGEQGNDQIRAAYANPHQVIRRGVQCVWYIGFHNPILPHTHDSHVRIVNPR